MDRRLTLSMPCYLRPQRTIRAIECIANQSINGWEALVTGDGCPIMADYLKSGYFLDIVSDCQNNGNDLIIRNNPINMGGHGYAITNQHIKEAKGTYFMFFANDDVILPNHFDNYLSEIENTKLDFVYFNSWVNCTQKERISQLRYGHIGHSELIIRTRFLKDMPPHEKQYGHDFKLIKDMMTHTHRYKKAESKQQTYWVMGTPKNQENDID